MNYDLVQQKAKLLRKWSLISTTEAASGHPTSCLSAADLGAVLFEKYFRYDLENPLAITNDRFVLSKGHASPLFYSLYAMSGAMPITDLKTLRQFGSSLEGHPTPAFKYTDAATGSLGQGLSVGAGMAYCQKQEIRNSKFEIRDFPKVFTLLGDGEMAEGQIWEAASFASHYELDNLIVIADVNRLGQSEETMFGHHMEEYMARFTAFGFEVLAIDGHNLFEIDKAYNEAVKNTSGKPYAIIAKTVKGKGVSFLENADNWHGKAVPKEKLDEALMELGEVDDELRFELRKPDAHAPSPQPSPARGEGEIRNEVVASYKIGDLVATREVYGEVLAKLGDTHLDIYALDGDMKNSTFSQDFLKMHPERFIECFISEQNMVSVAVGLSRLGKIPFVSTFDSFLTRAADQIRMAAISKANISFCGSHIGVSIGEDGPSQMGLENIGLFGAIPDAVIFEPSDAVSTGKIVPLLAKHVGISYLRTLRPKLPVFYANDEEFVIGGSKVLKKSEQDVLTIAAVGVTVHEALKAYEILEKDGIHVRIVDCYSLKPIDTDILKLCVSETLKPFILTVEDYFMHGGLGDLVLNAVNGTGATVHKLALDHISRSGKPTDLLKDAGIDAESIVVTVKKLIQ